jgi:ubiquinone/menaquinone biosynthesis C-methylase UbiE
MPPYTSPLALRAYRRAVRWAFARLYREFAWTYDAVAWLVSRGLWRRWLLAALPELHGRVLELGFGPGHLQLALAARDGRPALGLDASPHMAAQAGRRLARAGHAPRLIRGVAQAIPLPAASVDTVVATFPAEYILDPQAHAEIRRVLAPGGRIVIVDGAQLTGGPGADRPGLLSAWLGLAYARLIDLVYRLTLQGSVRAEAPVAAPPVRLPLAGFTLAARWVEVGPSRVAVIVGRRAEAR